MALKNYIMLLQLKLFPINPVFKGEKFVKFHGVYPQKAIACHFKKQSYYSRLIPKMLSTIGHTWNCISSIKHLNVINNKLTQHYLMCQGFFVFVLKNNWFFFFKISCQQNKNQHTNPEASVLKSILLKGGCHKNKNLRLRQIWVYIPSLPLPS